MTRRFLLSHDFTFKKLHVYPSSSFYLFCELPRLASQPLQYGTEHVRANTLCEREEQRELFKSTQIGVREMCPGSSTSNQLTTLKCANIRIKILLKTVSTRALPRAQIECNSSISKTHWTPTWSQQYRTPAFIDNGPSILHHSHNQRLEYL